MAVYYGASKFHERPRIYFHSGREKWRDYVSTRVHEALLIRAGLKQGLLDAGRGGAFLCAWIAFAVVGAEALAGTLR